jgi:hypothetical protein
MTRLILSAAAILVLAAGAPHAQSVSRGANGSTEAAAPRSTETLEPGLAGKLNGGVSDGNSCNSSGGSLSGGSAVSGRIGTSNGSAGCPEGSGSSAPPAPPTGSDGATAAGK